MKDPQLSLGNKSLKCLTVAIASLLSTMVLTACGGEGDSTDLLSIKQPENTRKVIGKVVDSYGNGIADANIQLILDKEYNVTTQADGRYILYLPYAYKYPFHFAGVVTKQNYVPTTIVFDTRNNQPLVRNIPATIRMVEDSDILFPTSLQVYHLGDANYTGSDVESTRFQYTYAHGKEWSATTQLSDAQKAKYNQLCIQGSYKGINSPNEITVSNGTISKVSTTSATDLFDGLGSYSELENCVNIDKFKANQKLTLTLKSVKTGKTSTDIDDFEFVNVRGVLKNSNDNNANAYNLAGKIVGNGGVGIEGFKVSVMIDQVEYSTVTDNNGQYILHLPKNIKYPAYFAGVATRQNYRPTTITFSSKNNIPELIHTNVQADNLGANYVTIPNSLNVMYLGTKGYSSEGLEKLRYRDERWQRIISLNQSQYSKYNKLCLVGDFKNVEYRNKIILSTDKDAIHQLAVQTTANTAADGSYTTLRNCFPLNKLNKAKDIYVTIEAVKRNNPGNQFNYDNFEFINLRGELQY